MRRYQHKMSSEYKPPKMCLKMAIIRYINTVISEGEIEKYATPKVAYLSLVSYHTSSSFVSSKVSPYKNYERCKLWSRNECK